MFYRSLIALAAVVQVSALAIDPPALPLVHPANPWRIVSDVVSELQVFDVRAAGSIRGKSVNKDADNNGNIGSAMVEINAAVQLPSGCDRYAGVQLIRKDGLRIVPLKSTQSKFVQTCTMVARTVYVTLPFTITIKGDSPDVTTETVELSGQSYLVTADWKLSTVNVARIVANEK